LVAQAWDSNLPFSNGIATNTEQAAFANPAGAGFGNDERLALSWAGWDTRDDGMQRLWAVQNQGPGHALGFRWWEGNGPYQARFDAALAGNVLRFFTPGIRPAYVWDGSGKDHLLLDGGLDFRPLPQFMAGYWAENLWTGGYEPINQRVAAAIRPWGARTGTLADFNLGAGFEFPDEGKRRGFVFTQLPLGAGIKIESHIDFRNREGSVGLILQATGRMAAAFGMGRGERNGTAGMPERMSDQLADRYQRNAFIQFRADQKTPFLLSEGNLIQLDLNKNIVEGETPQGWLAAGGEIGFLDLQKRFDAIEANPRIKYLLVKLGSARCGWSIGEEIRLRLMRLRDRGIRVTAYMEQSSPLNYFIATGANVIAMQPQGYFAVNGFAAEVMFYRGLFDKVGVEPQFLRHGKFKSFEEPYTRKEMSEPMRADLESLVDALWDHYLDVVAQGRGQPKDLIRASLESGEIDLKYAVKAGLIDTLIHEDQAVELAGGKHGMEEHDGPKANAVLAWNIRPQIAVVIVSGDMVLGRSARSWLPGPDLAGSETVADQLRRARLNPSVKAVVLRVDSPGGSAQAADIMWREVELLKKAGKPVIASVGHDAASGGYYLICGADRIIAAPNSVVGSIGVLWGKFVLTGLYGKLGLSTETVKTSPHADANSMNRPWDSTEVDVLQRHMDSFYDDFISKVAAGRKLPKSRVDSLGQGRVFTGTQALRVGLVDTLGGLQDAIETAAHLSGIGKARNAEVVPYSATGDVSVLSLAGRDLAKAGQGSLTQAVRAEIARIQAIAEPGLWAVDPELAGWSTLPGTARK
jgi:protease-4